MLKSKVMLVEVGKQGIVREIRDENPTVLHLLVALIKNEVILGVKSYGWIFLADSYVWSSVISTV